MKLAVANLATLSARPRLFVIDAAGAADLTLYLSVEPHSELGLYADVGTFLARGPDALSVAKRCLESSTERIPITALEWCAPIAQPRKLLGVGMNYHSFVAAAREIGIPIPVDRVWFLRPQHCVTGPRSDICLPHGATDLDYEAELAIVIGRTCRNVAASEARGYIAGYTTANDFTLRGRVPKSLVLAKSFQTHTPLGPWIVVTDELPDPNDLKIKAWVNGRLRQSSTTAEMIARCDELVAELSASLTLEPGDVILTGTPNGCGIFDRPPAALRAGDVVTVEIEGIGTIENRIVPE